MIDLCPISESHAEVLFPLIFRSSVTEWLVWDGPTSLQELKTAFREREDKMKAGLLHSFTILRSSDRLPIGSIGIAPNQQNASGDIGLWIGLPFQGRGYGTKAIALIAAFGFEKLGLERLEARVFVGNAASRRIFENNLFSLEGTLRHAVLKRGKFLDEWIFGLLRENYFSAKGPK